MTNKKDEENKALRETTPKTNKSTPCGCQCGCTTPNKLPRNKNNR